MTSSTVAFVTAAKTKLAAAVSHSPLSNRCIANFETLKL
jgi:hypothetical protein